MGKGSEIDMRVEKGYTYILEFRDTETGEIEIDKVHDYDLDRSSPVVRAIRKAIHLETEWVPVIGYFPNIREYKSEVRFKNAYTVE